MPGRLHRPNVLDPYPFSDDASLIAGTLGWSVKDLETSAIRKRWDAGRYEIIQGVLAALPPATFRHGNVLANVQFCLREHFRAIKVRASFASPVQIAIDPLRVLRADCAIIADTDLKKFDRQRPDWASRSLTLPPTIIIESVSRGHEAHDRVTKREWYAEFKVPHYWVIDGVGRTLECLRLNRDHYDIDVAGRQDDIIAPSSFAGLKISLRTVWEA